MPLPIAHGLVGATFVALVHPRPTRLRALPLLAGALLANAANFDFLLVFLLQSKAWHRGFTHSAAFALVVWLIFLACLGRRRAKEAAAYGLAYASHGLLDFLTVREGGGMELLWPFSPARLRLGWAGLSELPSRVPPARIVRFLLLEILLFTPLLALAMWLKKRASAGVDVGMGSA
ncbi:MAG: metal-dependent hydrolase [Chloroflexota bacterium]|nr:metal-dependent hydrolase [Chloroflexota bacterium]